MKRSIVSATLATALLAAMSIYVAPPAKASSGCSAAGAAGQWGYTYTGTIYLPSGTALLHQRRTYVQNASGEMVGRQTRSVAGSPAEETLRGRFIVKSDCTLTAAIRVYQNGQYERTGYLNGVYVDGMKHVRIIFEARVLKGNTNVPVVITLDGNRV